VSFLDASEQTEHTQHSRPATHPYHGWSDNSISMLSGL